MAIVVSLVHVEDKFRELNWGAISGTQISTWLKDNNVPAGELVCYLNGLLASKDGVDDATIVGCGAGNATKITTALKALGVVVV